MITALRKYKNLLILSIPVLFILTAVTFYVIPDKRITVYEASSIGLSVLFLIASFIIYKNEIENKTINFVLITVLAARAALIPIDPIGSNDIYRYIWDGKVQASGINPYRYAPDDERLQHLHSDLLQSKMHFQNLKTIYLPFAQMIFYFTYLISGESVWFFKFLLMLFELGLVYFILKLLTIYKLPRKNILYYILCPLPLYQLYIDGHIDGIGAALMIMSFYGIVGGRKFFSYMTFALSLSIKPAALLLFPLYFFFEKGVTNKIKAAVIPTMIFGVLYLPYIGGVDLFEALTAFSIHWTFNGAAFSLINSFVGNNQTARIICGVILLLSYLLVLLSKKELRERIYISTFLLLIFSPIVHPWYLIWFVILIPIFFSWSGVLYGASISLTAFTILNYELNGVWKEFPLVLILEYVPVILIFALEISRGLRAKVIQLKN